MNYYSGESRRHGSEDRDLCDVPSIADQERTGERKI